jgi:hypothetical protein
MSDLLPMTPLGTKPPDIGQGGWAYSHDSATEANALTAIPPEIEHRLTSGPTVDR